MPKEKKDDVKNVVLGNPTTQMGVMAVIVTTIVQPLVQIFHLAETITVMLALAVSFLCAFYQVRIMQELKRIESYIVIVLGTFIIFSTALGSNTLIGKDPQTERAGLTEQKIKNLEEQIKNKNDLLKALGIENNESADAAMRSELIIPSGPEHPGFLARATTIFETDAFAQDNTTATGDDKDKKDLKPRKRDAIKAYLEKQKKLHEQHEALEKQDRESKQTRQGVWKKW